MQWSTDVRQIKAALWDQAFIGMTRVSCPMGRVVAIRRRKGQLQAMIRDRARVMERRFMPWPVNSSSVDWENCDRAFEDQIHRASCLHLLMAAITAWNTVYLTEAIETVCNRGEEISEL